MCAWEPRSLELTKLLITAGCNPHLHNSRGETLLTIAVERGYISVVDLLLSRDLSPPSNILHDALRQRRRNLQMIQCLMLRGANVQDVASSADSVLHLATMGHEYEDEDEEYNSREDDRESECLDLVKSFIDAGCDPTACNSEGKTVLEAAIEYGYVSVVEHLFSCNVPYPPEILRIMLSWRCSTRMVEFLIRKHLFSCNVPLPPDILPTALRKCLIPEIIQLLLRKGYDVHSNTVLHLAITCYPESTCLGLVQSFTDTGCNPTACNSAGKTVLEAAIERGYISVVEHLLLCNVPFPPDILPIALQERSPLQMVGFLIRKGADAHSTALNGDTVFHLAIARYLESECLGFAKSFIEAGCSPTACNSRGKTVLEAAMEDGYTLLVEHLLSCNVPVPSDILQIALQRRWTVHTVEFLIHKGVDVHSTMSNGDSMLHVTIAGYPEPPCLDLMKSFINAGCNPTACNSGGETVLEAAIERGCTSVVELLFSYNVLLPPDILPIALRKSLTVRMVQSLLHKGADVRSSTSNGDTVLHLAITEYPESACWYLVKTFVEAGCSPTACNLEGNTALVAAMKRGYTSVVELLLSYNVPFPLDILPIALRRRCPPQAIELLVRKGAHDFATVSGFHRDPLYRLVHASYSGQDCQRIIEILDAAHEAKTTRPSLRDETSIRVAKRPRPE